MLNGFVPWPREFAARYRREACWRGETLGSLLRPQAELHPQRLALVSPGESWTYGALNHEADRLAAGLYALGIRKGDRVVVQLSNVPELAAVAIALFRIGAPPVFALPAHRRSEIAYLCQTAEAVAYIAPDHHMGFDFRALAAEVQPVCPALRHILVAGDAGPFTPLDRVRAEPRDLPAPKPEDVAFFLLSGGTTGMSKLIPRTHDDYSFQLRATAEAVGFDERGVYLASLPMAHNAALGCPGVLGALRSGGRAVLSPSPSPDDAFPLIQREQVTITTLMPSILTLWLETVEFFDADLSGVLMQVGGARLEPTTARQVLTKLGSRLTHWFGMAEGFLSYTRLDDPEETIINTQGRPLSPLDEVRVVEDSDVDVAPGGLGNLLVRGPYTLRGYYNAAEYNSSAFTVDGYLRTGDLVRMDPAGNMITEGRVKDIINRGGEKVSADEVEAHLMAHPAIRMAAVVPVPDALMGEKTCAFLVCASNPPSTVEVRAFLTERGVADYKIPDRLIVVERLPYTQLGKINKRELRESAAGYTDPSSHAPTPGSASSMTSST